MSGPVVRIEAQAKLNLFLRIVGREASGYHQLETLFQRIALADLITVRTAVVGRSLDATPDAAIHSSQSATNNDAAGAHRRFGMDMGPVEHNLAWRAAVAFADATGWPNAFAIEIEKHIPIGGGLGGGSADAAAVLRALNSCAPHPLSDAALAHIAFTLGADVPYLLSAHPLALATGRGERLHPLPPLPSRDVVLLVPPFGVSSRDAFHWYAALRNAKTPEAFSSSQPNALDHKRPWDWPRVIAQAQNDLEGPVFVHHPALAALRDSLTTAGASLARMTGSGSTVFGIWEHTPPHVDARAAHVVHTRTVDTIATPQRIG